MPVWAGVAVVIGIWSVAMSTAGGLALRKGVAHAFRLMTRRFLGWSLIVVCALSATLLVRMVAVC